VSFTGDLEYLPIVDVVQLLHATRKSGILRLKSRKGESSLVFKDGSIVSANHLNDSVRIGTILVERNILTPEVLDRALLEQKRAGAERKPLIITLVDKGLVKEEDAYRGLEYLIEMTLVEILTWKKGTFTMGVLPHAIDDEYRYYPGKMHREISVDAQGVLMDALCLFDEKMRDGKLPTDDMPGDRPASDPTSLVATKGSSARRRRRCCQGRRRRDREGGGGHCRVSLISNPRSNSRISTSSPCA
jgi:Domain of unknown function (DUF4388)